MNKRSEHSKRQEKKIIIVTGSMKRGGAERVISIVSNYFASLGWDVCIVSCLFPEVEYNLDSRIKILDISKQDRNQILDAPRLIVRLRKIIKQEKPDAVFSFMMRINFITTSACKGLKIHFYPSERNDPSYGRSLFWRKACEWAYGQSTHTIMQTKRARDYFSDKVRNKSIIIPNPVSVEEFASESKERVIVTVGRLERQKNQKMLIEAFSAIYKTHPDYKLRLFGRGSLESELKGQVENLGLTDAVEFMGNVEDVHRQIRNASLFVMTSNFEGLSNSLIEAMMMGLPCISTDCAGTDEIIDDGESGIIIRCGDVSALTEAMSYLIENKDIADKYGAEAHKRAKSRFNAETVCQKWKEIVDEPEIPF
jgi:glycosyltransferase involved in cell wall biosynthesis